MGQALHTWRSGSGQRAWLSALIETFEEVSRPEIRCIPCESDLLAALRAQIARPVSLPYAASSGLRH